MLAHVISVPLSWCQSTTCRRHGPHHSITWMWLDFKEVGTQWEIFRPWDTTLQGPWDLSVFPFPTQGGLFCSATHSYTTCMALLQTYTRRGPTGRWHLKNYKASKTLGLYKVIVSDAAYGQGELTDIVEYPFRLRHFWLLSDKPPMA